MSDFNLDGFKKFRRKGRFNVPKIAVRKNGCIAFNSTAVSKYDLDMYKYVMLFISEDHKRVAAQFTNNQKKDGLFEIQARKGNFQITAVSFLNLYDFDYDKTRNYSFVWNESGKTAFFKPNRRKDARERRTGIKDIV